MRLMLVLVVLGGLLPFGALYPHVGLLLWGWLTMMQPHQEVWGLPSWLQLNLITATATIGLWIISKEPKMPRFSALVPLIGLLLISMTLSQIFALRPEHSWTYFDQNLRVMAFVIFCLILLRKPTRIHAMVWVFVISIGYYAVLGGGFTAMLAGRFIVFGPSKTMIGDNNHLGVAIVTILPLCNYLRLHSRYRIVRIGLIVTMALAVVAIFGTHSRGALITFAVMCGIFAWKSRARFASVMVVGAVALGALSFMPDLWERRMSSIADYESDASFQGRVDAWVIAYEVALARPLVGVGHRVAYIQDAVDPYLSEFRRARAAHSVYLEFLGSMGFFRADSFSSDSIRNVARFAMGTEKGGGGASASMGL